MRLLRRLILCLCPAIALALPQPGSAAIYVAGDSLGVGVGMAGKTRSVAKNSVAITGGKVVLGQIAKIPVGSTIFLSLGTNDAVGKVLKVDAAVDAIIKAANARKIRIIWIGPPCVLKSWDKNAAALDHKLNTILAGRGVTYVSMRDASLCTRSVRARDGIHFNMTGYRMMWEKASAAAEGTLPEAGETLVASVAEEVNIPLPRPRPVEITGATMQASMDAPATDRPLRVSAVNRQLLAARFADAFSKN